MTGQRATFPVLSILTAPFFALSILMIFLDKCQMKSLENISILIKVKLFFGKRFYLKKKFLKIEIRF